MTSTARKFREIHTGHVWADTRLCAACWACRESCPEKAIGKVSFLWHKHIIFNNPNTCRGCRKCVESCPNGVFSEEMPEMFRAFMKK